MRTGDRRGFALVELVTLIGVGFVGMGLLLPQIQAAREAARRSQCTNNLKMIGLGMHNYHAANDVFPWVMAYRPSSIWTNTLMTQLNRINHRNTNPCFAPSDVVNNNSPDPTIVPADPDRCLWGCHRRDSPEFGFEHRLATGARLFRPASRPLQSHLACWPVQPGDTGPGQLRKLPAAQSSRAEQITDRFPL